MKVKLENNNYDTLLLPIEWRFSAAVVGLISYFKYVEQNEGVKLYELTSKDENLSVYEEIGGYVEGIKYNYSDITEERYLNFCEYFCPDEFPHIRVKRMLGKSIYDEEQKKQINGELTSNTIMKKVFEKNLFNGDNEGDILQKIEANRLELIKETYRYKTNLYRNFSNTNKLLSESNNHCRLLGYDLDENRKSKSVAYNFDKDTFVAEDCLEFDFIPFAFTRTRKAFFINNNTNINALCKVNQTIKEIIEQKEEIVDNKIEHISIKTKFIQAVISSSELMDYDVEVITKEQGDNERFETFFINHTYMDKLKKIYSEKGIGFLYKYSYNYWLDVDNEVIDSCIKGLFLDNLLEKLLVISTDSKNAYASVVIEKLLYINIDWKGEKNMEDAVQRAKKAGYNIGHNMEKNKARTYKNKLTNAIISHDYDRILEIMLQMSGFIGSEITTIYDIIDNKDSYSDIAIAFTNALVPYEKENK